MRWNIGYTTLEKTEDLNQMYNPKLVPFERGETFSYWIVYRGYRTSKKFARAMLPNAEQAMKQMGWRNTTKIYDKVLTHTMYTMLALYTYTVCCIDMYIVLC